MQANRRRAQLALVWVLSAAVIPGCAGFRAETPPPAPKPAAPAVSQPAAPPALALDPREERRLGKELVQAATEYYRLLREKNVEQAAGYADPDRRKTLQEDLWGFVARYRIESADIASYELSRHGAVVAAKVKVFLTLFDRNSVIPQKSQDWMNWEHRESRWILVSQSKR